MAKPVADEGGTSPSDSATDRWAWLAGTYWYVPQDTMLAILMLNAREVRTRQVNDQTLWSIEQYDRGYVIGRCAVSLDGGDFSQMTLVGSVTPSGDVCLSFAPVPGLSVEPGDGVDTAALTIGHGRMVERDGQWCFLMQMTGGTAAQSLTHWSYMAQALPGTASWSDIPGVRGTSIEAVFAASCQTGPL